MSRNSWEELFGAEDVKELKSKIIDVIVDTVSSDLKDSYTYIISPDSIAEAIGEDIVKEAMNEIKEEWKEKIKEYANKKLEEMLK